jgi:hypothetical protein
MIVGCLHAHACGSPLGMDWSTKLAPLHVPVFGGMQNGVSGLCEHPQVRYGCIVATATALFSSMIAIAPSGTTTPITTTATTATTTQQLHLVELVVGLGKVGGKHGDLVLGVHQVGTGAGGLLRLVDHLRASKTSSWVIFPCRWSKWQ